MWCMWGENWVVSFWLWGVWICMMAVGFSSSQAWCRAATHYHWTHCLSQVFITAPVYPCVFVRVCVWESRRVVTHCQINNLAEHFSTGLRVCASLIGGQSVYQKRVSECLTGTSKQPCIVPYNFRTMPIEKCFFLCSYSATYWQKVKHFAPLRPCVWLVCFLNGPYFFVCVNVGEGRLIDLEESILSGVKLLSFLSFSFLRALLETKL